MKTKHCDFTNHPVRNTELHTKGFQMDDVSDTEPPRSPGVSIDALLALGDDGDALAVFQDDHRDLIAELRRQSEISGKAKGGFTITVGYLVDRRGQIEMTIDTKTKRPPTPRAKAIAYVHGVDGIGAENPRQTKFQFASAPRRDAGIRSIHPKD